MYYEPVADNEYLEDFYADIKKYSFAMQVGCRRPDPGTRLSRLAGPGADLTNPPYPPSRGLDNRSTS